VIAHRKLSIQLSNKKIQVTINLTISVVINDYIFFF